MRSRAQLAATDTKVKERKRAMACDMMWFTVHSISCSDAVLQKKRCSGAPGSFDAEGVETNRRKTYLDPPVGVSNGLPPHYL